MNYPFLPDRPSVFLLVFHCFIQNIKTHDGELTFVFLFVFTLMIRGDVHNIVVFLQPLDFWISLMLNSILLRSWKVVVLNNLRNRNRYQNMPIFLLITIHPHSFEDIPTAKRRYRSWQKELLSMINLTFFDEIVKNLTHFSFSNMT